MITTASISEVKFTCTCYVWHRQDVPNVPKTCMKKV